MREFTANARSLDRVNVAEEKRLPSRFSSKNCEIQKKASSESTGLRLFVLESYPDLEASPSLGRTAEDEKPRLQLSAALTAWSVFGAPFCSLVRPGVS
ncbi:hypothetical protein MRX96_023296 [Rhipicephalus microplus]